jgi:hypothetical protein
MEFLRLFQVAPGGELTLEAVTIQQARLARTSFGGAAILNLGSTTLTNAIVRNNIHQDEDKGGAIRNLGVLTIVDTLVELNLNRAIVTGRMVPRRRLLRDGQPGDDRAKHDPPEPRRDGHRDPEPRRRDRRFREHDQRQPGGRQPFGAAVFAQLGDLTLRNTTIARKRGRGSPRDGREPSLRQRDDRGQHSPGRHRRLVAS